MKSFLTGSRRYGVPRDDSDTDIVILANRDHAALFEALGKLDVLRRESAFIAENIRQLLKQGLPEIKTEVPF